jgi:hypothetical protein
MKKLNDKFKAIIIPSCDDVEDIARARKAIEISKKEKYNVPLIVAGLGPDTNEVLEKGYNSKLDFHKKLYDYLMNETSGVFGVDPFSLNTIENVLNVFPDGTNGKYAIVSYPLQLMRIKQIVKDAQKADRISKDISVEYIPTKQKLKWISHEVLSNLKYNLIGKKKYFSK